MGDFTKKEYLLEKARVESAIAQLAPVTRTSVLDAGEFLQDFGQIWRVATDEERKKLLGSTIDIAYVLEGSILTINTSLPMLSLSPFVGHLARYPVELSIPLACSAT